MRTVRLDARETVTETVTNPTDASGRMTTKRQCLLGFLTLADATILLPKLRVAGGDLLVTQVDGACTKHQGPIP